MDVPNMTDHADDTTRATWTCLSPNSLNVKDSVKDFVEVSWKITGSDRLFMFIPFLCCLSHVTRAPQRLSCQAAGSTPKCAATASSAVILWSLRPLQDLIVLPWDPSRDPKELKKKGGNLALSVPTAENAMWKRLQWLTTINYGEPFVSPSSTLRILNH